MNKDKKNDWKKREGVVYSTESSFEFQYNQKEEADTLPNNKQSLRVLLDKSGRAGKTVTLVTGFVGTADDLDALARRVKSMCGTGGSAKAGEILLQGDVRQKVMDFLTKDGYRVRK